MPADLEERLAAYGRDLRATAEPIRLEDLHRSTKRPSARSRRVALGLAAALVIAVLVVPFAFRRGAQPSPATPAAVATTPATTTSAPTTSVAMTTGLPTPTSATPTTHGPVVARPAILPGAYPLLDGAATSQLQTSSTDGTQRVQAVVGRLQDGQLTDVVRIVTVEHGSITATPAEQSTTVSVDGRPAELITGDPTTRTPPRLVTQLDDGTDLVFIGAAAQGFADAQLGAVSAGDGAVGLRIGRLPDGYVLVDPPRPLLRDVVEGVVDTGTGTLVVASAQPQAPLDGAVAVDVNGHLGWQVGSHLSWREQAATWVTVDAGQGDDALAVARAVRFVDQPAFVASTGIPLPDFSPDFTTRPAPADPEITAFGESVMLGASTQLQTAGVLVEATESMQASGMVGQVTEARDAGWLGDTVVVQVGTNGTVTDEQLDAIVDVVGDRQVWFLTVKANASWIAANNERIRALPERHANAHVVDWEQRSAEIADQLSTSDGGAHLKTKRAMQFYANMIFDAVGRADLVLPLPA